MTVYTTFVEETRAQLAWLTESVKKLLDHNTPKLRRSTRGSRGPNTRDYPRRFTPEQLEIVDLVYHLNEQVVAKIKADELTYDFWYHQCREEAPHLFEPERTPPDFVDSLRARVEEYAHIKVRWAATSTRPPLPTATTNGEICS